MSDSATRTTAARRVWDWLSGWWVTYVTMSRAERTRIAAMAAEPFDAADWIEVERP